MKLSDAKWTDVVSAVATMATLFFAIFVYWQWPKAKMRDQSFRAAVNYSEALSNFDALLMNIYMYVSPLIPINGQVIKSGADIEKYIDKICIGEHDFQGRLLDVIRCRNDLIFWGCKLNDDFTKSYNEMIIKCSWYPIQLSCVISQLKHYYGNGQFLDGQDLIEQCECFSKGYFELKERLSFRTKVAATEVFLFER